MVGTRDRGRGHRHARLLRFGSILGAFCFDLFKPEGKI